MLEDKQAMTDITRTGNCACTEASKISKLSKLHKKIVRIKLALNITR